MLVKNDYIVHCIDFMNVKPSLVHLIIPWFLNFDQTTINETNTTWQHFHCVPKANFLGVSHQISFTKTKTILTNSTWKHHTLWCCHDSCAQSSWWGVALVSTLMPYPKQLECLYFDAKHKVKHKPINLTLKTLTLTSIH
jgi:hypothetical protein